MKKNFWEIEIIALVVLVLCPVVETLAQGAGRQQVLEGNKNYKEQRYDEAINSYRDALVDAPKSPVVHFNLGDALYQKRKYEEALKSYDESIKNSEDPLVQSQGYYNTGNTFFRLDKLQESILAYQQALKLNPTDEDAKFNLEYVRAKVKQDAQKQPQDQQQPNNPSGNARALKARADELVRQRQYRAAYDLMMNGMKSDPTVGAYQDFIQRIKDVVDVEG